MSEKENPLRPGGESGEPDPEASPAERLRLDPRLLDWIVGGLAAALLLIMLRDVVMLVISWLGSYVMFDAAPPDTDDLGMRLVAVGMGADLSHTTPVLAGFLAAILLVLTRILPQEQLTHRWRFRVIRSVGFAIAVLIVTVVARLLVAVGMLTIEPAGWPGYADGWAALGTIAVNVVPAIVSAAVTAAIAALWWAWRPPAYRSATTESDEEPAPRLGDEFATGPVVDDSAFARPSRPDEARVQRPPEGPGRVRGDGSSDSGYDEFFWQR